MEPLAVLSVHASFLVFANVVVVIVVVVFVAVVIAAVVIVAVVFVAVVIVSVAFAAVEVVAAEFVVNLYVDLKRWCLQVVEQIVDEDFVGFDIHFEM